MNFVVQVTGIPEIDPSEFSCHQIHWPKWGPHHILSTPPSSAFLWLSSFKLALSIPHQLATNSIKLTASPFSNHFLSITTKSQVSVWCPCLGVLCSPWTSDCGHRIGMLWRAAGDMNGKLNHTAWEYRRDFCHKTRGNGCWTKKNMFYYITQHWTGDETKAQRGYMSW